MERIIVNQRYLTKENIKPFKINILKSLCGTGKTTAIKEYLKDLPTNTSIIAPTFRRSLCSFLKGTFDDVVSYLDCHTKMINPRDFPRVCISPESFWRYRDEEGNCPFPGVLIWDEFCSFLEHIINTTTIKGEQRSYFINMMCLILQNPCVTVIICDAYFEDDDLQLVQLMAQSPDRIVFTENRYCEKKTKIYTYECVGVTEWKKKFFHSALNTSEKLYVFSNSKSTVQGLEQEYSELKFKKFGMMMDDHDSDLRMVLSADSSEDQKELHSSNPDISWEEKRIFYVTPTIQAGVSFTKHHFHKSFGLAIHGSGSVLGFLQQLARPRNLIDAEIHMCFPSPINAKKDLREEEININNIWNNLSKWESWTNMRITELLDKKLIAEKDRIVIRPDTKSVLNNILVRCLYFKVLQKINFKAELLRLVKNDWYEVIMLLPDELPVYEDNTIDYMTNIMMTIEKSKLYQTSFWENIMSLWDGRWPGDEWLKENKGGAFCQFIEFANEWGIFGVLGDITSLKEPFFDRVKFANFASKFATPQSQKRFHDFILRSNFELIDRDSSELRFNSYEFDGIFLSTMSLIFGAYHLYPVFLEKVPGSVEQINYLDNDVYTFNGDPFPLTFEMKELNLNNEEVFERICNELNRSYAHIILKMDLKMISQVKPRWLIHKKITQRALADLRKICSGFLKYIGLVRVKKPKDSIKAPVFFADRIRALNAQITDKKEKYKRRLNFNTYTVQNTKERIMLSMCKLFKKNPRGILHPNNIVPDPFNLLDFRKVPKDLDDIPENLQSIYPKFNLLKFWPIRDEFLTTEWIENTKIWGDESRQFVLMTHEDNILDRFDYWNPMMFQHQFEDPLPKFYVQPGNAAKAIRLGLPLRLWPDNPYKRNHNLNPQ